MKRIVIFILLWLTLPVAFPAVADDAGGLRMSALYTDHMVLQRDCPLVIRGRADAGAKVTVSIARQSVSAKADEAGRWIATLKPLSAGGPYRLMVTDGKHKLQYEDVWAGEVWLCSGQSNMEFLLKNTLTALEDVPLSANDRIRLYDMKARWRTDAVEWETGVLDALNHFQYYTDTRWEVADPQSAGTFSAVAYYFGKMLQDSLNVPVGLICNAIGGSPTEAWIEGDVLRQDFPEIQEDWLNNKLIQDWVRGRAALNIRKAGAGAQHHPYEPSYLFEAGIRPLERFPLRGVIWYQGESNAHNVLAHERLFRLLVENWRAHWENREMPFYYVQLSSLNRPTWCEFRDSQRRLMRKLTDVGMAVSSDKGDSLDVHPTDKKPVGERLARWALNRTYGMNRVVPSGPLFQSAEVREGAVYLRFDYGEGMHASDGKPLRTFEVAEMEGQYVAAVAEIENNIVKVYSDKVKNPRYVRYGWQPFTRANLVNGAELPASTFCSELSGISSEGIEVCPWQGFSRYDNDYAKGVSACFAGVVDGRLLIAGGCNFPKVAAAAGGTKVYYDDIYVADLSADAGEYCWQKVGRLPRATAYGVSVSTPDGIVCVGGMNGQGALADVFRLRLEDGRVEVDTLPSLPCTLDNMTGSLSGNTVYVAGGNRNGEASNAFYALNLDRLSEGWQELSPFPGQPRVQPVCAVQREGQCGEAAFYLWGGFAASSGNRPASLSVDGYKYLPASGEWVPLPAPVDEAGESLSLGGGAAVAWGDSLILCIGGVNKDIFLQALRQPAPDYLSHPVEWYRFNDRLLAYDTRQQKWRTLIRTPHTARAGAAWVADAENLFCIMGELKPGIRTPEVTLIKFALTYLDK